MCHKRIFFFFFAKAIVFQSLVGCCFLGNVILGKEQGPEDTAENIVISEPYLRYLLRGGMRHTQKYEELELQNGQPKSANTGNEGVV